MVVKKLKAKLQLLIVSRWLFWKKRLQSLWKENGKEEEKTLGFIFFQNSCSCLGVAVAIAVAVAVAVVAAVAVSVAIAVAVAVALVLLLLFLLLEL